MAERAGAPIQEIRRAGNWSDGVMEKHYLTHISLATLRALAGFDINKGGFHLPRAVPVPETLARKVFPQVERWYVRSHFQNQLLL